MDKVELLDEAESASINEAAIHVSFFPMIYHNYLSNCMTLRNYLQKLGLFGIGYSHEKNSVRIFMNQRTFPGLLKPIR